MPLASPQPEGAAGTAKLQLRKVLAAVAGSAIPRGMHISFCGNKAKPSGRRADGRHRAIPGKQSEAPTTTAEPQLRKVFGPSGSASPERRAHHSLRERSQAMDGSAGFHAGNVLGAELGRRGPRGNAQTILGKRSQATESVACQPPAASVFGKTKRSHRVRCQPAASRERFWENEAKPPGPLPAGRQPRALLGKRSEATERINLQRQWASCISSRGRPIVYPHRR